VVAERRMIRLKNCFASFYGFFNDDAANDLAVVDAHRSLERFVPRPVMEFTFLGASPSFNFNIRGFITRCKYSMHSLLPERNSSSSRRSLPSLSPHPPLYTPFNINLQKKANVCERRALYPAYKFCWRYISLSRCDAIPRDPIV